MGSVVEDQPRSIFTYMEMPIHFLGTAVLMEAKNQVKAYFAEQGIPSVTLVTEVSLSLSLSLTD